MCYIKFSLLYHTPKAGFNRKRTGNRSLNLGSNLKPSLVHVRHLDAVLNQFLSQPQLSDTCPSKVSER